MLCSCRDDVFQWAVEAFEGDEQAAEIFTEAACGCEHPAWGDDWEDHLLRGDLWLLSHARLRGLDAELHGRGVRCGDLFFTDCDQIDAEILASLNRATRVSFASEEDSDDDYEH